MKIHYILFAAALLLAGCKQNNPEQASAEPAEPTQPQVVFGGFVDTIELEVVPVDKRESYFDKKAKSATKSTTQAAKPAEQRKSNTQTSAQKTNTQAETIYVETDDSHGRVWGHVTMKGDRGTGTVHDEGENTWAVTVTRHGNELYAVDQNSRQYVFKLKK